MQAEEERKAAEAAVAQAAAEAEAEAARNPVLRLRRLIAGGGAPKQVLAGFLLLGGLEALLRFNYCNARGTLGFRIPSVVWCANGFAFVLSSAAIRDLVVSATNHSA